MGNLARSAYFLYKGSYRKYWYVFPETERERYPLPMVIFLHGGGSNATNAIRATGWTSKAEQEGFATVFPEGTGGAGLFRTWNAGTCCGSAMRNNMSDVEFIVRLKEDFERKFPIDKRQVFVAGFSNGGMLAQRLANEAPDHFAAVGCVAGAFVCEPSPTEKPISVCIIHGMKDRAVPMMGDDVLRFPGLIRKSGYKPCQWAVEFWVQRNRCRRTPYVYEDDKIRIETYSEGVESTEVVFCLLKNGNHAWPGGKREWFFAPRPLSCFSATDFLWDFFRRQERN